MFCCFVILLVFRTFGSGSGGKKKKKIASFFFKLFNCFYILKRKYLTIPQAFMKILAFINVLLSPKKCGGPIYFRTLEKGITDKEFSL